MERDIDEAVHALMVWDRNRKQKNVWEAFFPEAKMDELVSMLEQESACLWRYAPGQQPFTVAQWYAIVKSWKYKDSFPSLYGKHGVYDKREVVICTVMTAGMSPEKSDFFLDAMAIKGQPYESRRLYPLHFKEGFFRMLMAWGERNQRHILFSEAVNCYIEYEEKLYESTMARYAADEQMYMDMKKSGEGIRADDSLPFFRSLCGELAEEMGTWRCPLNLGEQDKLQRMLVLLSHYERCLSEMKESCGGTETGEKVITVGTVREKNRLTRKRAERGTALGLDVISRCAYKDNLEDAIGLFMDQAVVPMGEAYWRTVSMIMAQYAASGARASARKFVVPKVFSNKNSSVKSRRMVNIFEETVPDKERILSFALDVDDVKALIQDESANTVLIASLFTPKERDADEMFLKAPQDIGQTVISYLLRSYARWCRGEHKIQTQGIDRYPTPYYSYKRRTMMKFALACGCRTYQDMRNLLELSGSPELNPDSFTEQMVCAALDLSAKSGTPVIEVVFSMQREYLWQLSWQLRKRMESGEVDQKEIVSCAQKYQEDILYDMSLAELADKEKRVLYAMQIDICILLQVLGAEKQELTALNQADFYKDMDDLDEFKENCGRNLAEDILDGECHMLGREQMEVVQCLLIELLSLAEGFDFCSRGSASEWFPFFGAWFLAIGMAELSFSDCPGSFGEVLESNKNFLTDNCAYWAFSSGCRNFSLTCYEQKYGVNHFARLSSDEKPIYGNRWHRNVLELEKQGSMWECLVSDTGIIRSCYCYLLRKNPEQKDQYLRMAEGYRKRLYEAAETAKEIASYLRKGNGSNNLARAYEAWGGELAAADFYSV